MAIAQTDFTQYRARGYEGQVSTIDVNDQISRTVETAMVPFGRAVVRGAEDRTCALPSAASVAGDFIGFSIRTMAQQNVYTGPYTDGNAMPVYAVNEVASILRRGRILARCVGGASAGDTVHVVVTAGDETEVGMLAGAADAGNTVELTNVYWTETVADGDIAEIQADGNLA